MKVNFKRVATAALAVAMSLSLNVSAFAAEPLGNYSLTVEGEGLDGKTVYAIRMFTADVNVPQESGENTFVNYELEDNWIDFFKSNDMKSELDQANVTIETGASKEDVKTAALEYMEWLADEQHKAKWPDFADMAEAWFYDNAFTVTGSEHNREATLKEDWNAVVKTATGAAGPENQPDQAVFNTDNDNALRSGYYLIFPEAGSTGSGNRGTDAILYNIPRDAVENNTIKIKSTFPTVDKTVNDGNNTTPGKGEDPNFADDGSAQIGKVVTFTLTSAVPDMSKFTGDDATYVFQFTDKLSSGLTLADQHGAAITPDHAIAPEDVTLTINGTDVATGKFTVTSAAGAEADAGKTILTVKISNLLDKNLLVTGVAAAEGQKIVLTYNAIINENAVNGTDPVTNEAQVDYSNDPNTNGMGHSTPDISKVYNYPIDIFKYYKDGTVEHKLPGAKFVLSTDDKLGELTEATYEDKKNKLIPLVDVTAGDKTGQDYRVATSASEHGVTYVIDSDNADGNGKVTIDGLEAGTYYLYEITAPDTYNKLKEPVKIDIIVDKEDSRIPGSLPEGVDKANISFESPLYLVNGTPNTTLEDVTIKVENKQGIELPETGSIGTIGLTALGVVVVVA
uniref:isopeptide-forming domain-containing fimbrial protein n=1 Tax=uncultured Subdoligranulum sp. TaxID=512298 RepID=UPI0025ED983D